jgi:ZIP family zinc transporter
MIHLTKEMDTNASFALTLSTLAGLSTAIGGIIAIFMCRPKCWHMALILGFSAGVMLYISFAELLTKAVDGIGLLYANIAFFIGIIFIAVLDFVIPHEYEEERVGSAIPSLASRLLPGSQSSNPERSPWLMRVGVLTTLGIAIHNLPEGLVVFSSAIGGNMRLGIVVAIAIGLHNIPEGISVFVPIYEGSNSRRRAFLYTFLAGIVEPVGALLGYAILMPFLSPNVSFGLLAFAGGIMVYISLDELLPAAFKYGEAHLTIIGIIIGMMVMAASQILIM